MRQKSPSPANLELFTGVEPPPQRVELPSVDELYRMYGIYNREYFDNRLPPVKISYSRRMMAAGGYYPTQREIRISTRYHHHFPDEVYDTLKHEMIHVTNFRHDAAFKCTARRIGASVRANDHPSLHKQPRFVYVCPRCFTEYPRVKRLRMASCGRCSGKKFDERFKLVLKQSFKKPVEP
ncbi:MAG: SprT-like domain-containing protein [candidate division Zixibacteria bacterium]|nr:SprT-like domain-containing protein [candidate division Zixibacteria bacterium]